MIALSNTDITLIFDFRDDTGITVQTPGSTAKIVVANIPTSNGVIHLIDTVL